MLGGLDGPFCESVWSIRRWRAVGNDKGGMKKRIRQRAEKRRRRPRTMRVGVRGLRHEQKGRQANEQKEQRNQVDMLLVTAWWRR